MWKPTAVEPRSRYRLWLSYPDGVKGEVDLSHLAGRGVFAVWNQPGEFERVYLTPSGAIAWSEDLEICPDSLYLELSGRSADQVLPGLMAGLAHA